MLLENLHPVDRQKLREIAEGLFEASLGRTAVDADTRSRIAELMLCMSTLCVPDDADDVLFRLLAIADHRLGADEIEDLVLIEIAVARPDL